MDYFKRKQDLMKNLDPDPLFFFNLNCHNRSKIDTHQSYYIMFAFLVEITNCNVKPIFGSLRCCLDHKFNPIKSIFYG